MSASTAEGEAQADEPSQARRLVVGLNNQALSELLCRRGLVDRDLARALLARAPEGGLARLLVAEGRLTAAQLSSLAIPASAGPGHDADSTALGSATFLPPGPTSSGVTVAPGLDPNATALAGGVAPPLSEGHDPDSTSYSLGASRSQTELGQAPHGSDPDATTFSQATAYEAPQLAPHDPDATALSFDHHRQTPNPIPTQQRVGPGERFGPFQILDTLGEGGMGAVYRAQDVATGRPVALKVIKDLQLSGDQRERFLREGQLSAALSHPNVVQVYGAGEVGGVPYLACELIDGVGLKEAMRDLVLEEKLNLIAQVADGLGAAHARGITHRDVKPDNALVDRAGQVHVADFGLAFAADGDRLTKTGTTMGTPAYMAPEQVDGERGLQGPPTDVWALGVLLYEALTGARPFRGESLASQYRVILFDEPLLPRELVPGISPDLEAVALRALAKAPGERYSDAGAFAADLRRGLAGERVEAAGRSLFGARLRRWRSRLAVGVALASLAGVGVWFLAGPGEETLQAGATPASSRAARDAWSDARDDASRVSAWLEDFGPRAEVRLVQEARQRLAELTWQELPEIGSTEDAPPAGDLTRLRRYRSLASWLRDHGKVAAPEQREQVSRQLRLWRPGGSPPLLALLPGEPLRRSTRDRLREPVPLSDGRLLTFGRDPALQVWDLDVGPRAVPFLEEVGVNSGVRFAQEIFLTVDKELLRLDAGTLEVQDQVELGPLLGRGVVGLPQGATLVLGELQGKGPGGGWTVLPSRPWPGTGAPLAKRIRPAVRAGLFDPERGEVFLAGGSSDTGSRDYFLHRYRYLGGELELQEETRLTSAGYHLSFLSGGRILVGLNRTYALIFEADDLSQAPTKLSLSNAQESLPLGGFGYQCLGSVGLPAGGLLLSCDSYQKREQGWLAYFGPEQLAQEGPEPVLPKWLAPLPCRPRSLISSQDGSLLFLGSADGFVVVLPRFAIR